MKINYRVTVTFQLKLDVIGAILGFVIGTLFPSTRDASILLTGICLVHLLLYTPVGIYNGFDFIMHDEPDESPFKIYHFVCIFVAAALGTLISSRLEVVSDGVRALF